MKVAAKPSPTNYLDCREAYQRAYYRHRNFMEELMQRCGVSSFFAMEDHLLLNRTKFQAEIYKRAELERQLAAAEDLFQLATKVQRQRVAEQEAQLNKDFSLMDE